MLTEVDQSRGQTNRLHHCCSSGTVSYPFPTPSELMFRFNIKNPAGDYVQHERNLEVFRQISQAKAKREKEAIQEEKMRAATEEGAPDVPDVSE
jgi:hypothetical protein